MSLPPLAIAPYERRHRVGMQELFFHSYHVHTHLDWIDVDEWIHESGSPIRVATAGTRVVGIMGASAPLHGSSWLRVAAVHDRYSTLDVLAALWADLLPELRALGMCQIAALLLRDWPASLLPALGFHYLEDIVTLRRSDARQPAVPELSGYAVRLAREEDLPAITAVDHAAFPPPWQMTSDELTRAERSAAHSTVVLDGTGHIAGYQMSTLYFDGAHLARLAVDPGAQRQGVGQLLVASMLLHFWRRGVYGISVNTQATNTPSQRLYTRLGFARTGYDLPVWLREECAE